MSPTTLEASLWDYLRKKMRGRWTAERFENRISNGVPDVYYVVDTGRQGWMELKCISGFAKRPGTKFKIEHLTWDQRRWAHKWSEAGVDVWLLVRVGMRCHLLCEASALPSIGVLTASEFMAREDVHELPTDPEQFTQWLRMYLIGGQSNG